MSRVRFPRTARLRKPAEFKRCFNLGQRAGARYFRIVKAPSPDDACAQAALESAGSDHAATAGTNPAVAVGVSVALPTPTPMDAGSPDATVPQAEPRAIPVHVAARRAARRAARAAAAQQKPAKRTPSTPPVARLGIAISRKVNKRAVERNRVRRIVREWFRQHQAQLPAADYFVNAKPEASGVDADLLRRDLDVLFQRALALKPAAPHVTMADGASPSLPRADA